MAQGFPCALQKRLSAGSRSPHDLRDFLYRKVFEGLKKEGVALIVRQCLDRPTKGERCFEVGRIGHIWVQIFVSATLPKGVGELATSDSVEPNPRGHAARALLDDGRRKRFRRDVLGIIWVAESARQITINRLEVLGEERIQRINLTLRQRCLRKNFRWDHFGDLN